MDVVAAKLLVFVHWVYASFRGFDVGDASLVEAPMEIPDNAKKISNERLHQMYGRMGMSENISLFIHNGDIYVYYESVNGVKIWQSVEIPYGWRVKENFDELISYSWYNPDDSGFHQNLRILVFFDGGFLKLTFSSKCAHSDVEDDNFVRLMKIYAQPYSILSDLSVECHAQQTTMHQYVLDCSMLFVSSSHCDELLIIAFEEVYYDGHYDMHYCKVVLPLSSNVKLVEIIEITGITLFFNLWGRSVIPDFYCSLRVEMNDSQEYFSVKLSLIPPSDLENFLHDNDGLGLYKRDVNDRILGCEKSPGSTLCGLIEFLDCNPDDPPPNERLSEIFPVVQNK
jgi:hypothetical protein